MDQLLAVFSWLTPAFQKLSGEEIPLEASERLIVGELAEGWGKTDTAELLKGLSEKYGKAAAEATGKFVAFHVRKDWAATGEREAKEGTEIPDFIRLLWGPLAEQGFDYTSETNGTDVSFRVTKCPVHVLAEQTGLHDWLYQLACATDFYSTTSFSPKIKFTRTKTLMEGCDHCNHSYSYKR